MTVAAGADEPNPENAQTSNGTTVKGVGVTSDFTISGYGSIRGACFGPYDGPGIIGPGTPWTPYPNTCPPPPPPTIIPPVIIGPGVAPTGYPLPPRKTITMEETEFYKDLMAAIERGNKEAKAREREEAMKADEVYRITEESEESEDTKKPGFAELVVIFFMSWYDVLKPMAAWTAKATVAVAKLPIKATKLGVRAVKHTTLVMLPPTLFATAVVLTITGPRWIKWCCEVGGWPYFPPGQRDWTAFYVGAGVSIMFTLIATICHVVSRIIDGKWWWPAPEKG